MHVTKVLKTETNNKHTDNQEVVFVLDNYIQISGIFVSFDENGEFSGIIWPDNIKFVDTADELRVTVDLVDKLSKLMQAAPEAFEENNSQGSKFGRYVETYQDKILHHKYK